MPSGKYIGSCYYIYGSMYLNEAIRRRCEAVRHCRWVDEVVAEAPWVIDGKFLEKYAVDYVAHDEVPYVSAGHEDVYAFAKRQGEYSVLSNVFLLANIAFSTGHPARSTSPCCRQIHSYEANARDLYIGPLRAHRQGLPSVRF